MLLVSIVIFGTLAHGELVTIFLDDFEAYDLGTDPSVPPVGEPWQITQTDDEDLLVQDWGASSVLAFGLHRSTALAPFSAVDRQRVAGAQNVALSFDFFGQTGFGGRLPYFDIGLLDAQSGDPALMIRIKPEPSLTEAGMYDVFFLDPTEGLIDSGLNIEGDIFQSITITADLADEAFVLDIGGNSQTLPMFFCPEDIVGVEFAVYGMATGSGMIDNLSVTTDDGKGNESGVPELSTGWLLLVAGFTFASAWLLRKK